MSTQLRRIAQAPAHSPVRAKFFLALSTVTGGRDEGVTTATGDVKSVMTQSEFSGATSVGGTISANHLYRDMGREIVVVDSDNNHIQKWRSVQHVNNGATEGVNEDSDLYVLVWAADGANVNVVRTG